MKHKPKPWASKGKCYVCGRSTQLNIHSDCGKKVDQAKERKVVASIGEKTFNQLQLEKGQRNRMKKKYAAGYVPKFCYY